MKNILLLFFFTLSGVLFAQEQTDRAYQTPPVTEQSGVSKKETGRIELPPGTKQYWAGYMPDNAFIVTGGFEEVCITSADPAIIEFVRLTALGYWDWIAQPKGIEVTRLVRQIVRGYRYVSLVRLSGEEMGIFGVLGIFVIHQDICGEFFLLASYWDKGIFDLIFPEFSKKTRFHK